MANGSWSDNGRQPSHINMFQKILYGWVTPVELTSFTEIPAMPPSALNPVAYTIKANTNGELYVLENRQQVGFDGSVPGHGLLIWHVHPNALTGRGSNSSHPQQLYPVVASSTVAIPGGGVASYGNVNSAGAPFPGTSGKTSFTAKTTPAMFTWTGPQTISKPLTEITEATDGTIAFKFLDGPTEPVTNLQYQVTDANVKLTWTAPSNADVVGYKIYRDGILQYTISNKNTTNYTQIGVTNGTYEYGVTAYYEATESEKVLVTVLITGGSDSYCLPVSNLQANTTLDKASLNWTAPFTGGWQTIAGSASSVYNFGEETDVFVGTLWEPEHLRGLDGYELTQVQFYLYETATGVAYNVQVWEVDDTGIPVLIRDQAFTQSPRFTTGLKPVTLTNPVVINSSKGYVIGVKIHTKGESCLVVDGGPLVPERNYYYNPDWGWYSFDEDGIEGNFILSAYLSSGNPSSPNPGVVLDGRTQKNPNNGMGGAFIQTAKANSAKPALRKSGIQAIDEGPQSVAPAIVRYIIYRDGEIVGTSTTASFEDSGLTPGTTYSYCVSVEYSSGCSSEGICKEVTTLTPVNPYNPVENLKVKPAGEEVNISWALPFTGGSVGYAAAATVGTANVNTAAYIQAIRYTAADMKKWNNTKLTKVRFHAGANSSVNRTYTIQVWSGGNGSTPGDLVGEYELPSYVNGGWNEVTLLAPISVDIYQDLWIGVKVTRIAASGNLPLARYSAATVGGKSNLYKNNTAAWTTYTAGYNWTISATLEQGANYPTLTGYAVSRDGVELKYLRSNVYSYKDTGLQIDTYDYCVTAVYSDGESDAECRTITTEAPLNTNNPVENLTATLDDNKVTLNWDAPFAGGYIGYGNTTIGSAYNYSDVYMAARFTKDELKKMEGMKLTQLAFATYPTSAGGVTPANVSYTLCVWTGGNQTGPEELIYEQDVPLFDYGWNIITLDNSVEIASIYEDFWIGVHAVRKNNNASYPATYTTDPAVKGKGDMMYYNGIWQFFSDFSGQNSNWALLGYVEPSDGSGSPILLSKAPVETSEIIEETISELRVPEDQRVESAFAIPQLVASPDAFVISRDGEEIGTVAADVFTFDDELSQTGDYNYSVTAKYAGGESDPEYALVSFVSECDITVSNLELALEDNLVSLDWDAMTPKVKTILEEGFESGIPASWTNVDADGDTQKWYATSTGSTAHGGTGIATSASYADSALTPDNWLITPAVTLTANNILTYYVSAQDADYPEENYGVYISTTDKAIASFELLFEEIMQPAPGQTVSGAVPNDAFRSSGPQYAQGNWYERTIDLSAYEGETVYIAFRHYDCSDWFRLNLDDVSITKTVAPAFNVYQNDELVAEKMTDTHYETTLTDKGSYTYCVSFAGEYCESEKVCAEAIDFNPLTLVDVIVENKEYDATIDATISDIIFDGLDEGDELVEGVDYELTAEFSDAEAGTDKTVEIVITILGDKASKYWPSIFRYDAKAAITPKELTITGITADNKVYDGTTAVSSVQGDASLVGIIGTDEVTLTGTPVYAFADANVADAIAVIVSGFELSGEQKGNYTLVAQPDLSADITPKEVTITGITAEDKVYDGTTTATVTGTAALEGVVSPDDVTAAGTPVYAFADANVADAIAVIVSGFELSGEQKGNYTLVAQPDLSADITPKEVTITGITAEDKVYDGTTTATVTGTAALEGVVSPDDVTAAGTPVYAFADANVADAISVSVSGYELGGAQKGNYTLAVQPSLSAAITPAALAATPDAGQSKVYGESDPVFTYKITTGQLYGSDALTGSLSRIAGENAGTYAIETGSLSVGSNYTLTVVTGVTFTITPATLTVTPHEGKSKIMNDPDPEFTYDVEGWKFDDSDANFVRTAGLLSGVLIREEGEEIGFYEILQGTLKAESDNYLIDVARGIMFEIQKGLGIDPIHVSGLKVYPNPVKSGHEFSVATDITDATIQVFTLTGTLVKQQETTGSITKVSLTAPSGIYILSVGGKKTKIEVH
ncbi:hypothetical protein FACS189440_05260 [Bacteroidia bacterium]|nr:hypothetical protein FACS189440_05260 [Bacteroidia bacterium]